MMPKASPLEAALVATEDSKWIWCSWVDDASEFCRRPWITMAGLPKKQLMGVKISWRSLDFVISTPSQGFGACGPRGFYGGSLLRQPRDPCWRLELDSLNQICCLHSALKPW